MKKSLSCFKAYDIRGRVPGVLNAPLARALGRAVVEILGAKSVVIGRDARLSGPELRDALALGLHEAGAQVTDIGMCGTEEIYYAAANQPFGAGIMITGSHNPADENDFKLVRGGAIPISGGSGLFALRDRVASLVHRSGKSLAELVAERMAAYPCSGEINRRVQDAPALMKLVRDKYAPIALYEDSLDGVNLEFAQWRFNLRMSNTEPLLRLNVESRADRALLEDKTAEILRLLEEMGGAVPA